jgi:proteasome alpha subunit
LITPYDWQQSISHRAQYVEGRLAGGSPVIGVSCPDGVILVTVRTTVRKVFEIYDRLIFAGIGSQADLENLRVSAIDFTHTEGFVRSEDDVTIQRVVGSALSPALKKAFADPLAAPFVARAVFAEMGGSPDHDRFYVLNYDGEYTPGEGYAVVAGSARATDAGQAAMGKARSAKSADKAAGQALRAWGAARLAQDKTDREPDADAAVKRLHEELAKAAAEIGWLDRKTDRQGKFSLWPADRVKAVIESLK